MNMRKGKKFLIGIGLLLLLVIGGCFFYNQSKETEGKTQYTTGRVEKGNIGIVIDATGTINPVNFVDVSTTISGTLKEVRVKENQYVQAGDVIAVIDARNVKANEESAHAALTNAERDFQRYETLYHQGAVPRQMYDNALLKLEQARSAYAVAEANVSDTTIVAPMSGTVVGEPLKAGQTVAQGLSSQMIIATIADLNELEIYLTIDETDIGNIEVGQKVEFTVDSKPGKTFPGEISYISKGKKGAMGTMSNTVVYYTVKVKIPHEEAQFLLPSMTARAAIHGKEAKDTILVPLTALRSDRSGDYIYVIENGKPEKRYIKLGITGAASVQVLEGLEVGEEIIVSGNLTDNTDTAKRPPRHPGA